MTSYRQYTDPISGDTLRADTAKLVARVCRHSFWSFVRHFWHAIPGVGELVPNWHMKVIADEMQEVAERVFAGKPALHDTVINVSPGTSKSSICSVLFHPWTWTRMPGARHVNASHTQSLVLDLAAKSRHVINSDLYKTCFPEIELRGDQDAKEYYADTLGGSRYACTVGGKSPMGQHGHFLTVDDPIDPQKILSEVERATARDFVTNGIYTRMTDKKVSVMFCIMQRLGRGDPTEVIIETGKKGGARPVRVVCLPSELTDRVSPIELRDKYVDGLMDPVRLSRAVCDSFKARDAYRYAAQFLQDPLALGGGMFLREYFNNHCLAAPRDAVRIRYWDRACLVGSTMIDVEGGSKRIDQVIPGDRVLTRQGYKRVLRSWLTKYVDEVVSVRFANGSVVTGTEDHLVWTENRGWIELSSLLSSDYNLNKGGYETWLSEEDQSGRRIRSSSSLMGSSTHGVLGRDITRRLDGTETASECIPILCTGLSGGTITVTSPLDMTFTTRTVTGTTTTFRIWSASAGRNITTDTTRLSCGTKQKQRRSSGRPTSGSVGRTPLIGNTGVCSAEGRSSHGGSTSLRNIAPCCADLVTGWVRSRRPVSCVTRSSGAVPERTHAPQPVPSSTGTQSVNSVESNSSRSVRHRSLALVVAERNGSGGIPVYDLEVEDAHEFFANGILVHNSTQDGGCYTAGVLMARSKDGRYFVEHVVHGQWEPVQRNAIMRATALADRARYGPHNEPRIYVEAEGGSSGRDAWLGVAKALAGFDVREDNVTGMGSKDVRAEPWSAQLASGNVWIVDDERGTWDIDGYVTEHALFKPEPGKRLGKYKDQVDASSRAFSLLANSPTHTNLKIYQLGKTKYRGLRVVCCTREEIANTVIDDKRSLLLVLSDPDPLGTDEPPLHALRQCVDSRIVRFANVDPKDHQETWNDAIQPYGVPCEKVQFSRDHGRVLWGVLAKHRDPPAEVVVVCDDDRGRAMSVACGIADVLRLPRNEAIFLAGSPDTVVGGEDPPNDYVWKMVKSTRSTVV